MQKLQWKSCFVAVLVLAAVLFQAGCADAGDAAKLYVAPNGNDSWSGRLAKPNGNRSDGPLATISGAILKLRTRKPSAPVTVEIADGEYIQKETIVFSPEDSGSKNAAITFAAAPGANPVISGGRVISGWKKDAATGLWRAPVKGRYFRQLFADGKRLTRARFPNKEDFWLRAAGGWATKTVDIILEWNQVKPWRKGDDVEAVLLRIWDISRYPVISVDWKNMVMRLRTPDIKNALNWWPGDRRMFLENSISFLDSPGEWFLDKKEGVVYLLPPKGADVKNMRIITPVVDRLVRFEGSADKPIRHIAFKGLSFEYSTWTLPENGYRGSQSDVAVGSAIEADFVESITFEKCKFMHLGQYGVWLREGCKDNIITGCEFSDLGAGGVQIGENTRSSVPITHQTTRNTFSRNHIHHCGQIWKGSSGVWVGPANYTTIANNHIHDHPYSGVSVGWTWAAQPSGAHHNIIENNHIHDVVQSMSDGGGIYTLGLQPGTVIRNNIIHDNPGWAPKHWANGIYLDQGSSDMLIENNLVYRIARWGIQDGSGERNTFRNNIVAITGGDAVYFAKGIDSVFENNIVITPENIFVTDFPDSYRLDNNVYFRTGGKKFSFPDPVMWNKWRKTGRDRNSVMENPGFADLEMGDFTLKPDSPALKRGFKPFPLPKIGPPKYDYSKRITAAMRLKGPGRMVQWPVPVIVASRPSSRITIDGQMKERAWKNIKPFALRQTKDGKPHNPPLHHARVAYAGNNLFVLVTTDVPDMSRLHADGSDWSKHDWVTVCFQGVNKDSATVIFSCAGYASGVVRAFNHENRKHNNMPDAAKKIKYAASVGKNKWIAEYRIPLDAFGINPSTVKEFRFNIGVRRSDASKPTRKWSMWAFPGKKREAWHLKAGGLLKFKK